MPKKNIFKLIVVVALSIIIIVVLTTLISHQKGGYSAFRGSYTTQEVILDETRIIVTPLEISEKYPSRFRVNIESFEASDLIDMDLLETALIEFKEDNDPLLPTAWEVEHVSEYTYEGTLTFPPMAESTSSFTLVIFSLSEFRFSY